MLLSIGVLIFSFFLGLVSEKRVIFDENEPKMVPEVVLEVPRAAKATQKSPQNTHPILSKIGDPRGYKGSQKASKIVKKR